MHDPRLDQLADVFIGHSTRLQPGEHVLIETFDTPEAMVIALVRATRAAGGHPHVALRSGRVLRALEESAAADGLDVWADYDRYRMTKMDAYIAIRGAENVSERAGVPEAQMQELMRRYGKPVHMEQRVNHTKWVVTRCPSPSMAQLAGVSTEDFEDFFFRVTTMDYARMTEAVAPLKARMEAADRVRIQGPGDTDLRFSIRDIPVIPCVGERNIPDGECFTAPVRDSVNGVMHYNTPTLFHGTTFENIRFVFEQGRIVEATADQGGDALAGVLDTDEGARYIGEFSLGFNPYILQPMKDILFDEKIAGSLHFTPGQAYEVADNGNRSEVHWDLVLIQRPEFGGGRVWFDDELIREDGLFVPESLRGLNPDVLGA